MSRVTELKLVPEPSEVYLNSRQLQDYRAERKACLDWLLTKGKNPEKHQGYAFRTIKVRSRRIDQFYRWVWDETGGYTVTVTPEHGDAWLEAIAQADHSNAHKANSVKAVKSLFKWRTYERTADEWVPEFTFSNSDPGQPRDYLTREERSKVREAAFDYGSIPTYSNLSPSARNQWRRYLAQRFGKPVSDVSPADWERANGWKIPSLVWTSLDAGLRPVEVARATPDWVDVDNCVLRIPKSESAKSFDNWTVSLQTRTSEFLDRWIDERKIYTEYEDSEKLWLTNEGNPFGSGSLRYILHRLCEIADIRLETRQMSWYSLRHSTGTYMVREEDLAAAQAQLRHKSPKSTMRYDQAPIEDRQDALNRMG